MGGQNLLKQTARYAINQEVLKWLTKKLAKGLQNRRRLYFLMKS
jgi:hypothetical protein